LPLTQRVSFTTRVQRRNRIQVSKYIRWHFKLETDQYLQAYINILGLCGNRQSFLTRISKDGRIAIPKLNVALMQNGKLDLAGYAAEVTLEPL
jgi:hypothetical protein